MAPRTQASSAKGRMASEGFFVQDSAIAWPRDPLVAIDVRARLGTAPCPTAMQPAEAAAPLRSRRLRSGCPTDEHDRRALRRQGRVEMLFGLLVFGAIVGAVFAF